VAIRLRGDRKPVCRGVGPILAVVRPVQGSPPDVDYKVVPSAISFAEVLDQELARLGSELDAAPVAAPTPSLAPASFVPFTPFEIPFLGRLTAYGAPSIAPSLPSGSGEARARLALESTSPLPVDFTPAELRAAFRQLAREYHPDRHPDATGGEVLQYSRTFTTIASNYRRLASVIGARASRD
jgi:hypothetical protein